MKQSKRNTRNANARAEKRAGGPVSRYAAKNGRGTQPEYKDAFGHASISFDGNPPSVDFMQFDGATIAEGDQ